MADAGQGPADGPGTVWSVGGSIPKQIMTSATSVNVIISAAAAKKSERYHYEK